MARIVFDVDIEAAQADVVRALTTETGIRGWWTDDASVGEGVGGELSLGFPVAPVRFTLRVDEAGPDAVGWTSVGDFPPHWQDTVIRWTLGSAGASGPSVHFVHDGWATDDGPFGSSALTWGRLMDRLKDHCETGEHAPLFER